LKVTKSSTFDNTGDRSTLLTHCKSDIHSSKTANIILPGLMTKIECIWIWLQFCTRKGVHLCVAFLAQMNFVHVVLAPFCIFAAWHHNSISSRNKSDHSGSQNHPWWCPAEFYSASHAWGSL